MMATEVHQRPDATKRYEYGLNPKNDSNLPFNFERRPEIGESSKIYLEQLQALIDASLNTINSIDEISPYILREIQKGHSHIKEAYLRIMDSAHRSK